MDRGFIGVYIHVPFCVSKCSYCDFYSVVGNDELMDAYTNALCKAISESPYSRLKANSIYFGGGTPILLGAKRIEKILQATHDKFDVIMPEITIEANPYSTIKDTLRDLRSIGVNRLSIGIQSAINKQLMLLARNHTISEATKCIADAVDVGFKNISLDIMIGIPTQTINDLKYTIDFCTAQNINHISAYMLKIEEQTPFGSMYTDSDFDEDLLSDMYLIAVDRLAEHGYKQYEISNFCKEGYESIHNLHYWNSDRYIGIGPSAHSFMDNKRFYFPRDLNQFIAAPHAFDLIVRDDDGGTYEEYVMLKLRLSAGIDLRELERRFGVPPSKIIDKAKKLPSTLVNITPNNVSLTKHGFLLSNSVISKIIF